MNIIQSFAAVRIGAAISLDAFEHGDASQPCSDPHSYVACLASQRVDLLLQPEFNDGTADCASWSDFQPSCRSTPVWQPLEWMQSAWRAVTDPTVHFRYAVNPMMVGNLADLQFDGQSAITARNDPHAFRARHVGTTSVPGSDPAADRVYTGDRPGFLALAPWVRPDGSRAALQAESAALAPGSRSPEQDRYLQTAVYADLSARDVGKGAQPGRRTGSGVEALPRTGGPSWLLSLLGIVLLTVAAGLAGSTPSRRRGSD